ncbi:MAG: type II/IV secretion system ATPase subunit [Candidatus Aenigmatarchaeota archaeon]
MFNIKKLKGILYKKLKKENIESPKTRAGLLVHAIKKKNEGYPKFIISYPSKLLFLPTIDTIKIKNITYPLLNPYVFANIKYDEKENAITYNVIEPTLNEYEKYILEKLKDGLIQIINVSLGDIRKKDKMIEFIETNVQKLIDEYGFNVNDKEYLKIMYYIYRDFIGLNEIEPLIADPFIEDIGCDGVGVNIYIVHQKFGSLKTNIIYDDENKLREFVTKLAERCDRYISYAEPLLDGTLPDGARVQASLAQDVTTRGPTFSIRKFRETPFTPVDMLKFNTLSSEMLAYLWFIVENGANILIAGGVSTGKTSLLNCISLFIPSEAKIVSIEDTRELNLPHENWIPGVSRAGFTGTGVGEVTMFELLRESFRQNPDYLIVGEIRGKEAYVMFQGMASGHPSISTMHAGSIEDVMRRLQTKPIGLSPGLLDSLDVVITMVHAREKGKSARRVKEIVEIESIDPNTGIPRITKTFVWLPREDSFEYKGNSWILNKISIEKGIPMNKIVSDIAKRKKLIEWLYENNITDMREIIKYLKLYHRRPEKIEDIIDGKDILKEEDLNE